jgi:alpha-1,3-mannosyltransferase
VQVLFAGVYLLTNAIVMMLYAKSEVMPPYLHILLTLSKRLHSIYVLRLFNDCWTMLIAYMAVYLLMRRSFAVCIATFSLAVSTKMNVLLFAPGVLIACLLVRPRYLLLPE